MTRYTLTHSQARKFAEGYNAKVALWNAGENDQGESPYHQSTWADIGYGSARSKILRRQLCSDENIVLAKISARNSKITFKC